MSHQTRPSPSGTGESHLVEALAHAAIEKDLRVAWFTLETPTAAIARAEADGSVTRTCRSDLIVVDDISMLPAGQDAAEAFYRITDAVYEHPQRRGQLEPSPGWRGHQLDSSRVPGPAGGDRQAADTAPEAALVPRLMPEIDASRRPLGAVLEETPAFQHCCDELLIRRDAE